MSLLERTRNAISPTFAADRVDPRALAVSAGYGAASAALVWLVLLIPSVMGVLLDGRSTVSWSAALSFAGAAWALVHRAHVAVPNSSVTVFAAPLLLTAGAVAVTWSAYRHLARREQTGPGWQAPVAFIGGYAGFGVVVSLLALLGPAHPNLLTVVPGAVLVSGLGVLLAAPLSEAFGLRERLPVAVWRARRVALEGIGLFLGVGLVLLLLLVLLHVGRVGEVNSQLAPGVVGGALLWFCQLCALPNLALLAGGWLTGGGVSFGDVGISLGTVQPGTLPMLPMLGALPEPGSLPILAYAAPLVPLAVGAVIGVRSSGQLTSLASLRTKIITAATAAGLAWAGLSVLLWLAAAGVTPGKLAHVAANWAVLPTLAVELFVGAVAATAVQHYRRLR